METHNDNTAPAKGSFFTKEKNFYKTLFSMMSVIALQNLVAFSVNMADNMMLGSYSQDALSGAATVNQIFFLVTQYAASIASAVVVLCSQYWGAGKPEPIRKISGIALKLGFFSSIVIIAVTSIFPRKLLTFFTSSESILTQGMMYLNIIQWTFIFFILTQILMGILRSIGVVKISFYISLVSLVINVGINYTLIFGKFGFPEMGIKGAAFGTFAARIAELGIVLFYILKLDKELKLFEHGWRAVFSRDAILKHDFARVCLPVMLSQTLWAVSIPVQTAILGHLSDNAIAANSVATTFYQYLKVIVQAMSAASSVLIGMAIGRNDIKRIKSDARTLAVIDVVIGVILGCILVVSRHSLLRAYNLTPEATVLAQNLILVMAVVMVGMSYQMPVLSGIMQGAGDTDFTMYLNIISIWLIVIPLSLCAAFWWKLPVEIVVLCVQSDQLFKGIPAFIRFRSYKWIKKLTR